MHHRAYGPTQFFPNNILNASLNNILNEADSVWEISYLLTMESLYIIYQQREKMNLKWTDP